MMQTELLTKTPISSVGEEITHELGAQMIKNYRKAFPTEITSFVMGRDIIDRILAQPGCVGMKLYNAINEKGEKTLVYVGIDQKGTVILESTIVTQHGVLETKKGIVADRLKPNPEPAGRGGAYDDFWWLVD